MNITQQLAASGSSSFVCPVHGCPSAQRPMNARSWWNHLYRAHLRPQPTYRCPYLPCTVESRDPGMRVHVQSHEQ